MAIDAVIREAEFFCIQPLVEELKKMKQEIRLNRTDLTKAEFFHCLTMARIKGFMLSMSGMKMRGMDFSHMQLLNVHFSMCDLEVCTCCLSSSLSHLNLYRSIWLKCCNNE